MRDGLAGCHRVGGHRLQFYATDEEIAEWLLELLPSEFAPYAILWREWRDGRWQAFERPLHEVLDHFARCRSVVSRWIRSDVLSPGLAADDDRRLSFSGLICVQLGRDTDRGISDSSISIVDRIRHEITGRERKHPVYRKVFERLRRAIRKHLVVTTALTLPDGSVEPHRWRLTARAAKAHARGEVRFDAEPIDLRE